MNYTTQNILARYRAKDVDEEVVLMLVHKFVQLRPADKRKASRYFDRICRWLDAFEQQVDKERFEDLIVCCIDVLTEYDYMILTQRPFSLN